MHAGTNLARWVENILKNPNVRLLIGDKLFELNAVRVASQSEFDEFAQYYQSKYGSQPRNEDVDEAYLLRLEPRSWFQAEQVGFINIFIARLGSILRLVVLRKLIEFRLTSYPDSV